MNNIVFVNRYFYPDYSATSQLLSDLAFDLSQKGFAVTVVCSRQLYDDPLARLASTELVNGVLVKRTYSTTFGRARLVGRAIDYGSFYVSASITLLAHLKKGSVVVAKTDPPMISVCAGVASVVKRAVLVNWMQDIFPEVADALGVRIRPYWLGRLVHRLRDWTLRVARKNVVLGDRMRSRLLSTGASKNSIVDIPNWADGTEILPVDRKNNPLISGWGLEDKFVVGYSGNLGRAHEVDTIIDSICMLKNNKDIVFLFIGGGAMLDRVRATVRGENLQNVNFRPYQPRESLALSLSVPHIHLISLRPDMEGFVVPSKLYGVMAAARPCINIGDPDGEVARVLYQCDGGCSVRPGDVNGLVAAVQGYASNPTECETQGRSMRYMFEKKYNKPIALKKWSKLIEDVVSSGGCR